MPDASTGPVPRTPEGPTAEDVLDAMTPCEPYSARDLVEQFDDTSRWTIQRRLESLHEEGLVNRKKHAENRVTWWVDPDADT